MSVPLDSLDGLLRVLARLKAAPAPEEVGDALWLAARMELTARRLPGSIGPAPASPRSVGAEGGPAPTESPQKPSPSPAAPGPPAPVDEQRREATPSGQAAGPAEALPEGVVVDTEVEVPLLAGRGLSGEGRADQGMAALALRVPGAPVLPESLKLSRRLRPLRRRVPSRTDERVDEDATAERIAEEDIWLPVLRPAASRWLEVALVVDVGPSMPVWQETARAVRELLERHGAFGAVRVWRLDTARPDRATLTGATAAGGARPPEELRDAAGRRLVLVVSDCVSPAWHSGAAARCLAVWARTQPMGLLQMLPSSLWPQTALGSAAARLVRVHARRAGTPAAALQVRRYSSPGSAAGNRRRQAGLVVPPGGALAPLLTLTPGAIGQWARLIAGELVWTPGAILLPGGDAARGDLPVLVERAAALSPAERVGWFRSRASSETTFELATLLAAAPLRLPVMRLVQQALLPEARQEHLAEFFSSGLLERAPGGDGDPEQVHYEFLPGVRDALLGCGRFADAAQVQRLVSWYVQERFGQPLDFEAYVADPSALDRLSAEGVARSFASVTATILKRLGGAHAEAAARWERRATEVVPLVTYPFPAPEGWAPVSPARTHVLVVGAARYRMEGWALMPAADNAEAVHQWLRERGVPPENITRLDDPTREAVAAYLNETLPRLSAGLFILYWSGYGFLSENGQRRLLYADTDEQNLSAVNLDALLPALHSDLYPALRQQIILIDAGATVFSAGSVPEETYPTGAPVPGHRQFVLFASRAEETAWLPSEPERPLRSLFTNGLFAALSALEGERGRTWPPDMEALAPRVLESVSAGALRQQRSQTPVYYSWGYPLPQTLDLQATLPPVRDQGSRGTSVAFAAVAAFEHYLAARGVTVDLSEDHLYWSCKRHDGDPTDEETYLHVAFARLMAEGCCTEAAWSYDREPPPAGAAYDPPPGWRTRSLRFRPPGFRELIGGAPARTDIVVRVKEELALGRCVTCVVVISSYWESPRSGRITHPLPQETPSGGHTVCLVGYRDEADEPGGGVFLLRNSWGESWGTGGYGIIPYAYLEQHCHAAYSIAAPGAGPDAPPPVPSYLEGLPLTDAERRRTALLGAPSAAELLHQVWDAPGAFNEYLGRDGAAGTVRATLEESLGDARPLRVFLSGPDWREREALRQLLSAPAGQTDAAAEVVAWEDYRGEFVEQFRARIAGCDLYLGVTTASPRLAQVVGKGGTEEEYRRARAAGQRCLVYLREEEAGEVPVIQQYFTPLCDLVPPGGDEFHVVRRFRTIPELERLVQDDLARVRAGEWPRPEVPEPEREAAEEHAPLAGTAPRLAEYLVAVRAVLPDGREFYQSGLYINREGAVVTGRHAVEGAREVWVTPVGGAAARYVVAQTEGMREDISFLTPVLPPGQKPPVTRPPRLAGTAERPYEGESVTVTTVIGAAAEIQSAACIVTHRLIGAEGGTDFVLASDLAATAGSPITDASEEVIGIALGEVSVNPILGHWGTSLYAASALRVLEVLERSEGVPGAEAFFSEEKIRALVATSPLLARGEAVRQERPLRLFATRRQQTWLVATDRRLFCLLDDKGFEQKKRLFQWSLPLSEVLPVQSWDYKPNTGRVDIGPRRGWLYSKRLHPDPGALVRTIEEMAKGNRGPRASNPPRLRRVAPDALRLVYTARRAERWDAAFGQRVYRFDVTLDGPDDLLARVAYVQYLLPPAWPPTSSPKRITERARRFALRELAWGNDGDTVGVRANVVFATRDPVLSLSCEVTLRE